MRMVVNYYKIYTRIYQCYDYISQKLIIFNKSGLEWLLYSLLLTALKACFCKIWSQFLSTLLALLHAVRKEIHFKVKIDLEEQNLQSGKIITAIWVTCVQNNSQIPTLIKQLLAKYWFSRNCLKFHIFTKNYFSKYNCNFLEQLLLHYKFIAVAWEE